ncbi:MAG: molybdopterin-dependent oxidoreductase [Desulfobacteraceae bacterium]|nr:molybdopterin-dependent oxidoreductase [Desulfobacteraceae bacterium]
MELDMKKLIELAAFNRRNFIKLLVGGAVGTHLSPIPWKLADDSAIWTQNWPWIPVPPVGEFFYEKTVCKLCPGGCGIEVRKVDHRAVKIEGRTDYPVNPGGICPLGMGGLQLLYNENIRFPGPMKRSGPRGAGEFGAITWDEAIGLLAGRISDLRKKGSPETLVAVDGNSTGSTISLMVERLLKVIGSPNYTRIPSAEDSFTMANLLMQGHESPMAYDLENADFVLSFGAGLLEGWGAPGRVINAWRLWREDPLKRKARVVQIESRASNTASKADQWAAIRPGTEAALALGLAHVIIKENLYDTEFINSYSFGFNDWMSANGIKHTGFRNLVSKQYSPSQVAEITGLSSEEIVSLAAAFARADAPIALCGKGKGALNGSLYEFMCVNSLNALVGNINKPGGVLVHDPLPLSPLPDFQADAIARSGLKKPRLDQAGSMKHPFSHSLINNLTDAIIGESQSPVDTLLVLASNPVFTLPAGGAFRKALTTIPFIVSFSPYRDETANMADLILPDHNYLEKLDEIVWPTGLQYPMYGLTRPVVEPVYGTRNSGDVIIQLAKRIGDTVGSAFPWKGYEEVLKTRVKGLFESKGGQVSYNGSQPVWQRMREGGSVRPDYNSFDTMWKKIKSGGLWYRPLHKYRNWERIFKTPSGRFEFFSSRIELAVMKSAQNSSMEATLKNMGIHVMDDEAFMPHYEPVKSEKEHGKYPLLMVPYEMINLSSGWLPNPPYLNKTLFDHQLLKDASFAEINPKTAAGHNLVEGDMVMIESPKGKVQVRVNLFEGAMPGIVYLPLGFGHTAYDKFLQGKGVNPNHIISEGKDPLSGYPVWWNTPVKLTKV